jgi:hypothetical protein
MSIEIIIFVREEEECVMRETRRLYRRDAEVRRETQRKNQAKR